jgi:hypothetical protein
MDVRTPLFRRDSDVVTEERINISQNRVCTGVALSLRQSLDPNSDVVMSYSTGSGAAMADEVPKAPGLLPHWHAGSH